MTDDTWEHTRSSVRRLKKLLREADEDTLWDLGFWLTGLATMAATITWQFGWVGLLFCFGFMLWAVGHQKSQ